MKKILLVFGIRSEAIKMRKAYKPYEKGKASERIVEFLKLKMDN